MKRTIVITLERLCGWIDNIPALRRDTKSWTSLQFYRHGCFGCYPLRLTNIAVDLDERWGTGVWGQR